MTTRANRIERYYDTHPVEGEELGQSRIHYAAIRYLIAVLEWLFNGRELTVLSEVNFYQTDQPKETPKCPDVAVVDGSPQQILFNEEAPSYYVGADGLPPRVAFEVASRDTWKADLEDKPALYAALGIKEYFAFDPNTRSVWTRAWREQQRLMGWRLDETTGQYMVLPKDENGRIWSEQLESWLVIEGKFLRLYSAEGELRLTSAEFKERQREFEYYRAEQEYSRAEQAERRAETERRRAESERMRAENEQIRAEQAERRIAELEEMLRRLQQKPQE